MNKTVRQMVTLRALEIRNKKPTLPVEVARQQAAEQMLDELFQHIHGMFAEAERQGLYIGMGKDSRLHASEQEGPMVKQLRKLVGLVADEHSVA